MNSNWYLSETKVSVINIFCNCNLFTIKRWVLCQGQPILADEVREYQIKNQLMATFWDTWDANPYILAYIL
jgi:hypothetical protein